MLCMLPPLMSYSLAPSSTMISCTVHSPMDSLAQPSCIVVYIVCNPAPRGSPFELSLNLCSNSQVLSSPPSQSPLVWWFVLGSPWVTSLIHLHGGTSSAVHTHNYHKWHLTIYLYQVRSIGTSPFFIDAFTTTSIDVEWLFSHGHLLLSHVQS